MVTVGIDPGVSPSVVIVGPDKLLLAWRRDLSFDLRDTRGRDRAEPDLAQLADLLKQHRPDLVVIEQVGSRPQQGVSSTGRFLYATGLLVGCVKGLGFEVHRVTPQVWQRAMVVRNGKDGSRLRCGELLPGLVRELRFKVAHNLADAGLMALYGQAVLKRVQPPIALPAQAPAW